MPEAAASCGKAARLTGGAGSHADRCGALAAAGREAGSGRAVRLVKRYDAARGIMRGARRVRGGPSGRAVKTLRTFFGRGPIGEVRGGP